MYNLISRLVIYFIIIFCSFNVVAQGARVLTKTDFTFQLHGQHVFIGSSLILILMCLTWARASRSYSMAMLALFFAVKSLGILVAGGASLLVLLTSNPYFLNAESVLLASSCLLYTSDAADE